MGDWGVTEVNEMLRVEAQVARDKVRRKSMVCSVERECIVGSGAERGRRFFGISGNQRRKWLTMLSGSRFESGGCDHSMIPALGDITRRYLLSLLRPNFYLDL